MVLVQRKLRLDPELARKDAFYKLVSYFFVQCLTLSWQEFSVMGPSHNYPLDITRKTHVNARPYFYQNLAAGEL